MCHGIPDLRELQVTATTYYLYYCYYYYCYYSPLTCHYALLTTHYPLPTTYDSLRTAYYVLPQDGDIVNVDVSPILDGVHSDLNETFCVGNVDPKKKVSPVTHSYAVGGTLYLLLTTYSYRSLYRPHTTPSSYHLLLTTHYFTTLPLTGAHQGHPRRPLLTTYYLLLTTYYFTTLLLTGAHQGHPRRPLRGH